jgi:hypothetical protein
MFFVFKERRKNTRLVKKMLKNSSYFAMNSAAFFVSISMKMRKVLAFSVVVILFPK